MIIAVIVTAIIAVYGIELGTRVATGSGNPEYLAIVVVILILLAILDVRFYLTYKKENKAS